VARRRHRAKKGAILLPIDFKAVDFGTCQIDSIRLWEGL
jgi:hypothetical protein